jgi:hypothetical protein
LRAGAVTPTCGETVRIAHVHIGDLGAALRDQLQRRRREALEPRFDVASTEPHAHAVVEVDLPSATRIEA